MSLPKHIVVATDFSEASQDALDQAAALATAGHATVSLVHVFDPTPAVPLMPPAGMPAPGAMEHDIEQQTRARIREELESVRTRKLGDVPNVELVIVRHASAASAICEHASEVEADLIVVGTHGRTGIRHALIGSVAERVVRHAPCPVLAVRAKTRGS